MTPTHKNIINKWLKLYLYSYKPSYFLQQIDENFCKNIPLYFKSSNEFIQMKLVEKNGWTIQYMIKNGITPSEKVQLTAVNQNGSAICYIENPSEKVQLAAVNRDVWAIYYIKNLYPSVIELHEEMSGLKYDKKHQFIP
jgi:hypothetical protein